MLGQADLRELSQSSVDELRHRFGLRGQAPERLVAAFALARLWERERRPRRPRLSSPERVWELLEPRFRGSEQESFISLLLDGRHRLRRIVPVTVGLLGTSLVHPREVFRPAVRDAAAAVIVAHNHPSGDPEPSREDEVVTRRLLAAGRLLGIPLLDHVIVGEDRGVSMRERSGGSWTDQADHAGPNGAQVDGS